MIERDDEAQRDGEAQRRRRPASGGSEDERPGLAAREIGFSRETINRIEGGYVAAARTRAKVLLWLEAQEEAPGPLPGPSAIG